jgi:hypothetical protein
VSDNIERPDKTAGRNAESRSLGDSTELDTKSLAPRWRQKPPAAHDALAVEGKPYSTPQPRAGNGTLEYLPDEMLCTWEND